MKRRTMLNAGRYPKAPVVSFDNRSTNRKTHPHSRRLCREKSIENALDVFRIYAGSGILHCYQHAILGANFGFHTQEPLALSRRSHCVYCIDGQVQDDLLQLNPVAEYPRQLVSEFAAN